MTRILSVLTTYPPSMGGAQQHAHVLHQRLAARGHEVAVATTWRETRTDWALGTTLRSPGRRDSDVLDGVPVHHVGLDGPQRRRAGAWLAAYPPAMRTVAPRLTDVWRAEAGRVLDATRPEVLHLSRIGREWMYEAFVQAAAERGIPFVLTPNHHPHWTRPWHWWWWDLYRRASRVLVLSDAEADQLVAGGVARGRILRTVVGPVGEVPDPDAEIPAPPPPPTVTFLGQIRHYKGVEILHAAMRHVWAELPEARLVVVGPWLDGPDEARDAMTADPRVDLLGSVEEDEKWARLRAATVLCVPSEGEALGGVYLEAWTVGRPAVGADIPPVRELFARTGGGVVAPREPEALAVALIGLLRDPDRAAAMGRAGLVAVANEYNWDVAADRAEQAYADALSEAS